MYRPAIIFLNACFRVRNYSTNKNSKVKTMNIKKVTLKLSACVVFLGTLIFSGCRKDSTADLAKAGDEDVSTSSLMKTSTEPYVRNELLVKFKPGLPEQAKGKAFQHISGAVAEKILTKTMQRHGDKEGVFLIHTPLDVLQAIGVLQGLGEVEYAEPNYIYTHDAVSNDTYFTNGSLWGMYGSTSSPSNQYGSRAAEAWTMGNTGSSDVIVGVIDQGIMNSHEDLEANCWINPFDPVDGIDNDGNGYVDDKYGWDFDGNNNTTFDGSQDNHATHVAGTIGGQGGNNKGVAGICWSVKMISCKFLGKRGGTAANAIKAIDYITDLKTRHNMNIVATNNSWGGGGFSQSLKNAIDRAGVKEILFIAAAGNDGLNNDGGLSYPSGYTSSNIIAVASITSTGGLSSFSNYGASTVDIGAPGSGIYSTLAGRRNSSAYGSYSGTSMAAPHVTGAVALYAATHPGSIAATIKNAILSSAVNTPSLSGKCVTGGRLNVAGF